jgi:phenylacetate-coenzyme A ligase PaaK-like adenylate-forming protein
MVKSFLKVDESFKEFLEDFRSGKYVSPLEVPVQIWGSHSWELIDKKVMEEILLHFIRFQVDRAKKSMPGLYKKSYDERKITGKKINSVEDFWRVPGLVKDSGTLGMGIREKVRINPSVMLPQDVKTGVFVYKSGGTKGVPTPTFITNLDREIESTAFKRGFEYEGMKSGDVSLSVYNPTHKGGEEIKEGLAKLGLVYIPKRTTDTSHDVIQTIKDYSVNVLFAVQGPISDGDRQNKGGIDLLKLIEIGEDVLLENIEILFLGGYRLIPEAIAWAESNKIPLVTLLGSSEAIPQATCTNIGPSDRICKHNNLHVLNGPHYIEILKHEDGILVPAKNNEEGILAYTTVAREGTIYIRYMPGDSAIRLKGHGKCNCGLKSEIITDVGRSSMPEEVVETGCVIG